VHNDTCQNKRGHTLLSATTVFPLYNIRTEKFVVSRQFYCEIQTAYGTALAQRSKLCVIAAGQTAVGSCRQEAQLSPSDRAMRLVSINLANYHATVQKLLIRQVQTKPMV